MVTIIRIFIIRFVKEIINSFDGSTRDYLWSMEITINAKTINVITIDFQ